MYNIKSTLQKVRLNLGNSTEFDDMSWRDDVLLPMIEQVMNDVLSKTKTHIIPVYVTIPPSMEVDLSAYAHFIKRVRFNGEEVLLTTSNDMEPSRLGGVRRLANTVVAVMSDQSPCIFSLVGFDRKTNLPTTCTNSLFGTVTNMTPLVLKKNDIYKRENYYGVVDRVFTDHPHLVVSIVPIIRFTPDILEEGVNFPENYENAVIYGVTELGHLLYTQEINVQSAGQFKQKYTNEIERIKADGSVHHSTMNLRLIDSGDEYDTATFRH